MRKVKLTKHMLKMTPSELLIKIGAYHINGSTKVTYPDHVYVSKKDAKTFKNNLKKALKKSFIVHIRRNPTLYLKFDWLNYGPNCSLQDAIVPGYLLVDEQSIENDKSNFNKNFLANI